MKVLFLITLFLTSLTYATEIKNIDDYLKIAAEISHLNVLKLDLKQNSPELKKADKKIDELNSSLDQHKKIYETYMTPLMSELKKQAKAFPELKEVKVKILTNSIYIDLFDHSDKKISWVLITHSPESSEYHKSKRKVGAFDIYSWLNSQIIMRVGPTRVQWNISSKFNNWYKKEEEVLKKLFSFGDKLKK